MNPATRIGKSCISIFRNIYCINCNQGEYLNNYNHPTELVAMHVTNWQDRCSDCSIYHTNDYCVECHMEVNYIVPNTHLLEGWNGSLHAQEAQTNFENCSVCHTDGDMIYAQCHQ